MSKNNNVEISGINIFLYNCTVALFSIGFRILNISFKILFTFIEIHKQISVFKMSRTFVGTFYRNRFSQNESLFILFNITSLHPAMETISLEKRNRNRKKRKIEKSRIVCLAHHGPLIFAAQEVISQRLQKQQWCHES